MTARLGKPRFTKSSEQFGEELALELYVGLRNFQDFVGQEGTEILDTEVWEGYVERDTGRTVSWRKVDGTLVQDRRVITDSGNLRASLQKPEPKKGNKKVTAVIGWDAYYAEQVITGDYIDQDGKPFYRTPRDWVTLARERVPVLPFLQEQLK